MKSENVEALERKYQNSCICRDYLIIIVITRLYLRRYSLEMNKLERAFESSDLFSDRKIRFVRYFPELPRHSDCQPR